MTPRIASGNQISLISYTLGNRQSSRALGVPRRTGRPVDLVEVGDVASQLIIWRTGFRYDSLDIVGFGTGHFEDGPIYFGACVSFLSLNGHFLSSPNDNQPLIVEYKNETPRDTEAFILLDEHGASSQTPVRYGDIVILQRVNGRYLHCVSGQLPAFRSSTCSENEKFRIWF